MLLIFDRKNEVMSLLRQNDSGYFVITASFKAANNVASNSRGPWPAGLFKAEKLVRLPPGGDDPNGPYGAWFLRFIVPDRDGIDDAIDLGADGIDDINDGHGIGMGIHAGRRDGKDAIGRQGFKRATMGCIRTTDMPMDAIAEAFRADKACQLVVLA